MADQREVAEIDSGAFEGALRGGADVTVLDTREPEAFEAWHVESAGQPIVNLPAAEVLADPEGALNRAGVPTDARLLVLCRAGTTSRAVAAALEGRSPGVLSVRGGIIAWSRVLQSDEIPVGGVACITQFRREARGCLSYLVAAGGEALVVDPAPGIDPYLDAAAAADIRITHVLDTHIHADHVSGARELARATGARLHLSDKALLRGVRFAEEVDPLRDGERTPLGEADVRVTALPGHTSDMTGVLVDGRALIGGDSLFADSVARPDLEVGDAGAADAARILRDTIHARIGPLADDVLLLPGHYAGGRLSGPVAPTLGEVRQQVRELSLDEDAFVDYVLSAMPPRPANYLQIIEVNLGEELAEDVVRGLEVGGNSCAASVAWSS